MQAKNESLKINRLAFYPAAAKMIYQQHSMDMLNPDIISEPFKDGLANLQTKITAVTYDSFSSVRIHTVDVTVGVAEEIYNGRNIKKGFVNN
jgi:hypothetical protein